MPFIRIQIQQIKITQMPFGFLFEYFKEANFNFLNLNPLIFFSHYHRILLNVLFIQRMIIHEKRKKKSIKNYIIQQQIKLTQMNQSTQKQKYNIEAPNHTRKLGNKQFAMYLKSQPKIATLTYNIEKYLSAYQPFYYNAFLSLIKGRDLDHLERQLQLEYNRLVQGKSFLHKINGAIFSRSKCLQKIKRDLTKVQSVLTMFKKSYFRKSNNEDNVYIQYTRDQGYTTVQIDQTIQGSIRLISTLFLDMSRFRDMTIYIIQTIHRWRVSVEEWMDRCQCHSRVDFYIKNQQQENGPSIKFYDVVRNDTDFLWSSKLSQHIWLQFKNDPLLTRNVVNVSQRTEKQILQKYFVQILYPNHQQIIDKTIKALDILNYVYKPKELNLYEQQQKLIQNYLGLERKNNQQIGLQSQLDDPKAFQFLNNSNIRIKGSRIKKSQSESKITVKKQISKEIEADNKKWYQNAPYQSPYMTKSQVKKNSKSPKSPKSPKNLQRENPRGWVFGKQLKSPATDRIRQIIKKHEFEMTYLKNHKGIIKPFNITNITEKKSIALAYLSEKNNAPNQIKQNGWIYSQDQRTPKKSRRIKDGFKSAGQAESEKKNGNIKENGEKNKKLYQSLAKINTIIEQDPKEHENQQQTPKNKAIKKDNSLKQSKVDKFFIQRQKTGNKNGNLTKDLSKTIDKKETNEAERKVLQSGIKINTLFNNQNDLLQNQDGVAEIQIEQQQTPLNFRQFFEVFRADTKQKPNTQSRATATNKLAKSSLKKQQKIIVNSSIRKFDRKRSQSLKNPALRPYYSQNKNQLLNKNKKNIQKSKNGQKSQNSFKSYNKVSLERSQNLIQSKESIQTEEKLFNFIEDKQYINLKSKQITKDMISKYIIHICSQLPFSCQAFTNYHTQAYVKKIIETLEDCTVNSLIFDIQAQKDGKIGQAIVIQSLSTTLKMRYTIQFINVHKFELIVNSVCRISEQLLSTSPCQQVVLKLVQDKADPVSSHFIALIDSSLRIKAQKFSYFHILEKKILGLTHQNLHERVYIFQAKSRNLIKEAISQKYKNDWRKRVAGSNYRSLVFETKCVALSSNFKLRSENLNKASIQIYKQESLGLLFIMLFHKIMTRYHLKQLKIASLSLNDVDQATGLVKKSPFLRSIFYGLLQVIKKTSDEVKGIQISNWIKNSITKFTSMTDLLNYLSYKQYEKAFKFQFLAESRFILNHQLTLSELNLSTSLDFVLQNSSNMLLINNHHRYTVQQISRKISHDQNKSIDQFQTLNGYLLPTTQSNLKLFFMSAKQYYSCSDSLDLFSYLQLLFRQSTIKQRHDIEQLAIPDLTKRKNKVNDVKMYDGFLRLFPERQFYSASLLKVQNLWQNFYPNAIISMPRKDAIIIQYPIIVGFYDSVLAIPIVSYCLKQEK